MELNNIELNFIKIINLFEYKVKEFEIIERKILLINNNVINTINNNEIFFKNKIISDKEYKNNLDNINNIILNLDKIKKNNFISNKSYYDVNLFINNLLKDILTFNKSLCSFKLIDVLDIYDIKWRNSINNNLLNSVLFFNTIFNCIKLELENNSDKENGYIEVNNNEVKKTNIFENIHGAILKIHFNNKIIIIFGYFINDNLNLIKNNKIFNKKNDKINKMLKKEVIPDKFKEEFYKQLSLRTFIVNSSEEIINIIKDAYSKNIFYKSLSLTSLLHTFSNSDFNKQRDILTILIISDTKSATLASLLYDILLKKDDPFNAKILYLSLNKFVQSKFDFVFNNFNENVNKLKSINIDDISYEKRISLLDTSDLNKTKAIDKLKMNNGGSLFGTGDNKSQNWLDGFLKIPFNCYKTNKIFTYVQDYKNTLKSFTENIKNNNLELYNILNKYDYPETDYQIDIYLNNINNYFDKYIQIIDDNIIKDKIYDDFQKIISMWNNYIKNRKEFILNVREKLNKSVYGNEKSKKTIETIIAQWMSGNNNGAILGFNGPPGVGKTTLAKKGISECLVDDDNNTRPFAFIPLGGSTNGSTLEGHNYTYVGSTWGKIVEILMDTKCLNPIIFFDEVDKISNTEHGKEIIGILTHLTDQTQNDKFNDKYFSGIDLDLSKALFIFSYNDPSLIDPILKDRITEIKINHLNLKDKIIIVKDYLLPEICSILGYKNDDIIIEEDNIIHIIDSYTYEAGVRKLKEKLFEILRVFNLERIYDNNKIDFPYTFTKNKIDSILEDHIKINFNKISNTPKIGFVNGLYATSAGIGGLTVIEVTKTFSETKFSLELTGHQGDIMKESVKCAKTIAWNLLSQDNKKIILDQMKDLSWGLHVHTPDGATPKDGPSAGAAITLAILSFLINSPIKNDIAMTGEIDLNGNIKKIGGLTSKLSGAKKAGVKTVLVPHENLDDLELIRKKELSNEDNNFNIITVNTIYDVIKYSFTKNVKLKKNKLFFEDVSYYNRYFKVKHK